MKFAIMSLAAAGALALTADTASAQWRGYGGYNRGFNNYYGNYGGFNRGFNPGWSGTNITIGRPGGFGVTIGSGNVFPSYYGGYNSFYRPYYGGYNSFYRPGYGYGGYRGYNGWRW